MEEAAVVVGRLLKDTFQCDTVAFQRLLSGQSFKHVKTRARVIRKGKHSLFLRWYATLGGAIGEERAIWEGRGGSDRGDSAASLSEAGTKGQGRGRVCKEPPPIDTLKPGVLILFPLGHRPPPPSLQDLIHPEVRLQGSGIKALSGGVYVRNITFSPPGSGSDGHVPTAGRRPTYPAVMHMSFYSLPILKEARQVKRYGGPAGFASSALHLIRRLDQTHGAGVSLVLVGEDKTLGRAANASWLPPPARVCVSTFSSLARIREYRELFFFLFLFSSKLFQLLTSAEGRTLRAAATAPGLNGSLCAGLTLAH